MHIIEKTRSGPAGLQGPGAVFAILQPAEDRLAELCAAERQPARDVARIPRHPRCSQGRTWRLRICEHIFRTPINFQDFLKLSSARNKLQRSQKSYGTIVHRIRLHSITAYTSLTCPNVVSTLLAVSKCPWKCRLSSITNYIHLACYFEMIVKCFLRPLYLCCPDPFDVPEPLQHSL